MRTCDSIERAIREMNYEVVRKQETDTTCTIDFRHPSIKWRETKEGPAGWFLSSVHYDLEKGCLEATVRRKVSGHKEVYLDYCCEPDENGECLMQCRPHVWMEGQIFSVEASFCQNPIKKFGALLSEML